MLLYICSKCGAWSDVTLADAWAKVWEPFGKSVAKGLAEAYGLKVEEGPVKEPAGWLCPVDAEHGLMRAVSSGDRLFVKPAIVEAEQGESAENNEQEESVKREQIIAEINRLAGRRLGLVGMNDVKKASTARLQEFLATVQKEARYL